MLTNFFVQDITEQLQSLDTEIQQNNRNFKVIFYMFFTKISVTKKEIYIFRYGFTVHTAFTYKYRVIYKSLQTVFANYVFK